MSRHHPLHPVLLLFSLVALAAAGPDAPRPLPFDLPLLPTAVTVTADAVADLDEGARALDRRVRRAELRRLRGSRTIDAVVRRAWLTRTTDDAGYAAHRRILRDARRAAGQLTGSRGAEHRAALRIAQDLAAEGILTTDRLPAVLLTLRRNTDWWTRRDAPAYGRSIVRGGDPVTLRYVPGRGLVLHQLASWGRVAALSGNCLRDRAHCPRRRLRSSVDRLLALGVRREGVLRFESYFRWGGARAPWISAMTQGTAIQALVRTSAVLRTAADDRHARAALGAFDRRAPFGVSTRAPGGSHFVMYSTEPGLRILNGHLRALTGLRDLANLGESGRALRLFRRGEGAARVELREADTGAWSRYSDGGQESSLGYHRLVTGFLADLCDRRAGKRYCAATRRFRRYLREPTRVTLDVPRRPRARDGAGLSVWVSKISTVSLVVRDARGRTVLSRQVTLPRGRHDYRWIAPRRGTYTVRAAAVGPGAPPVGRAAASVRALRSRAEVDRAKAKAKARAKGKARATAAAREQAR